jgi:hypothetical protein
MAGTTTKSSRLIELTEVIAENTKKIDDFFEANGIPTLSFDPTGPSDFPVPTSNTNIYNARRIVVNATQELHDLMVGPRESLRWAAWSVGATDPCCVTSVFLACAYLIAIYPSICRPLHPTAYSSNIKNPIVSSLSNTAWTRQLTCINM